MDVKITFNDFTVTGANQLNNVTIKLLKGEKGDPGEPTDAQVTSAVNTWLAAHPEATTTVQDGAISYAKLDSTLKAKADDVDDLKSSISQMRGFDATTKAALLALFQKCAFVDDDAQTYYDALESALYPPAGVESISVVYTQSGVMYDTAALDTLKADLVVTAYYDDETSAVVENYGLSGTLTAGTSTITASYGGKTATFNVTVTHDDSADWDYIWRYTDGLPPASDWAWTTAGGSGQIHEIQSDGMLMAAKGGTNATYTMSYAADAVLSAGGAAIEYTFYFPSSGSGIARTSNSLYASFTVSDGTNGLRIDFAHPKTTSGDILWNVSLRINSSAFSDNTVLAQWSFDTPYKLKLVYDAANKTGSAYLNDTLLADNIDATTVLYATSNIMYTNGVTVDSTAQGFCVQSVKVKYYPLGE